ncbi:hypothetical protein [Blastococcus capsensis]|uniref:hypothetical protein n=1 Tax=Blastococcus capsensis TaxID=1564163 RepID=UPI0025407E5C|nr:hypothetical protein [Blastococcus capsensis]MDK3255592.1 hypothetical protein [Blastococcus capsensis]
MVRGGGVCVMHGGHAPQVAQQREARVVVAAAQRMYSEDFAMREPGEVLLAAVQDVDAIVQKVKQQVECREELSGTYLLVLGDWLDRAAKLSKTALDAGVQERQGEMVAGLLRTIFADPLLALSPAQAAAAPGIAARHLRQMASGEHPALTVGRDEARARDGRTPERPKRHAAAGGRLRISSPQVQGLTCTDGPGGRDVVAASGGCRRNTPGRPSALAPSEPVRAVGAGQVGADRVPALPAETVQLLDNQVRGPLPQLLATALRWDCHQLVPGAPQPLDGQQHVLPTLHAAEGSSELVLPIAARSVGASRDGLYHFEPVNCVLEALGCFMG